MLVRAGLELPRCLSPAAMSDLLFVWERLSVTTSHGTPIIAENSGCGVRRSDRQGTQLRSEERKEGWRERGEGPAVGRRLLSFFSCSFTCLFLALPFSRLARLPGSAFACLSHAGRAGCLCP